jgi:hypothetical protein
MTASSDTIEQAIATFTEAAAANLDTPTRRGNLIALTADTADEIMITADLHGNRRNFNRLLEIADLENHPRRHLLMQEVCHGGPEYPGEDGGCMSHLMLEDVAQLKLRYRERFHFLISNHEWAELMDFPILKAQRMLNLLFRCGMQAMYGKHADRVREAAKSFIRSLPLALRAEPSVFVSHSAPANLENNGFDPQIFERPLTNADFAERGPIFRLVWGRDFRPANAKMFAELVGAECLIQGHEPCEEGFDAPNDRQLILDCCGENATYVILPVGRKLSHKEVVEQVKFVHGHS